MPDSQLLLAGDHLALIFPYDPAQVREVKQIPGARWDRLSKTWRAPLRSIHEAREFARRHEFFIEEALAGLVLPETPQTPGVVKSGKELLVTFPYDEVKIAAIHNVTGAKWRPDDFAWVVPATSLLEVVAWADDFNVDVSEEIREAVGHIADSRAGLAGLSTATHLETPLDTPGLNGELLPFQHVGVAYALQARRTFLADQMGLGKGQRSKDKVLTPTGWTTYGALKVGDSVVGSGGTPATVTGTYQRGRLETFRVSFNDGTSVVVDGDHLWAVTSRNGQRWHTLSTLEMMKGGTKKFASGTRTYEFETFYLEPNGNLKWQIPLVAPVEFDPVGLPLDPYVLGAYLGDGSGRATPRLHTSPGDAHEMKALLGSAASTVSPDSKTISLTIRKQLTSLGLHGLVAHEKFVPEQYLRGTPEQRLSLLQGLMDTDGYAGDCSTEFSTVSDALKDAVVELAQSLGGVARTRRKQSPTCGAHRCKEEHCHYPAWRVNVKLPPPLNPFRLGRKRNAYDLPSKYPPSRYIKSIEPEGFDEIICISVDTLDSLYVVDSYVVTHNTVQAIAALHLGDALPAVVVCPPTLVLNWVNEIRRWLPDSKVVTLAGLVKKPLTDKAGRRKPASPAWPADLLVRLDATSDPQNICDYLEDADFIVLGYSVVGAWRPILHPKSLVCDESQYIKNKKAKRTKATVKLAQELPGDGMTLCLTGTPILNRPAEFYPQLAALGHISDFGGEWAFYKRYCGMYTDRWGKVDISGATHKEELNDKLRATCYVRRTKEEVLPDLTPIRHQIVPVAGDPEQMREYRKAEADIARYMAERAAAIALELGLDARSAAVMAKIKAEAAEHIVRLSALRRLAALAKIPTIREIVDSHLDEGSKVVIAGHHRDVVSGLADVYGGYKIQGGMSVDDVERNKLLFQESPDVPVIVLSIQAAKAGHTLTAAQDILMAELPWTPADADQVISRLHRIGQKGSVLATWLLCNDTLDHDIYGLLQAKRAVVNAVTDGGDVESSPDVAGDLLVGLTRLGLDSV